MKKVYIVLIVTLILLSSVLVYKNFTSPIKIALLGNFQEERYDFSTSSIIAGRIAEKDINDKLGIKGRRAQLIIVNEDGKDTEKTIKYLKENKIEAVITTDTSQELVKIKPYYDSNKIVCISAGATSSKLANQQDYIYRVMADDEEEVNTLNNYLLRNGMARDIVLIYNKNNIQYKKSIEENLKKLGNTIVFEDTWDNNSVTYSPKNTDIMKDKVVLILASSRDTAFIIQKLNISGIKDNIFGLSWSGGQNLKLYGGRAIEGFKFISSVDFSGIEGISAGEFTKKLEEYGKTNGLMSTNVYDAYNMFRKAYEIKFEKHISLKDAMDSIGTFEGLNGKLRFNEYGDLNRDRFIYKVESGEFVKQYKEESNESAKN